MKEKILSYIVILLLIIGLTSGLYQMGGTEDRVIKSDLTEGEEYLDEGYNDEGPSGTTVQDKDTSGEKSEENETTDDPVSGENETTDNGTETDETSGEDNETGSSIDTSRVIYDASSESLEQLIDGNNEFSLDLYRQLDGGENMFYSPWSISTALAMTYEGARGETRDEIREVFGYPENATELRKSYGYLHDFYNTNASGYKLNTANSLWAQEGFPILDDYRWLMMNYYFAQAENVNFGEPEKACGKINNWVKNHTNSKIEELVAPGMVDQYTRLILANAIHFKGLWEEPFNENDTYNSTFHASDGSEVTVPFMNQEGHYNYTSTNDFKILQKKYVGNDTSMVFALPKDGDLSDEEVTYEKLKGWREDVTRTDMKRVSIPKFNMSTEYDLKDDLKDMGMPMAFDPNDADLSGIDGGDSMGNLFIQFVKHKAFVEVDEKGTEAAAATAVGIGAISVDPRPTFTADSPFLFFIQDDTTGNILFQGRLNDPTSD